MSSEATLAYTVHHKGRKYRGGMTAEEIGPAAAEFGDHVWVDGKAPAKKSIPAEGDPDGGTALGTPSVPAPSGLPGPATPAAPPAPEPTPEPAPRTGGSSRRSGSGS